MSAKRSKVFETQRQVLAYLHEQGYKVAKSTLSNHVRAGYLKKSARDGLFHQKTIDAYARINLPSRQSGKLRDQEEEDLQRQIRLAEKELKEANARYAAMKADILEGKYVPRKEVEHEMAARIALFLSSLQNWIHREAEGLIKTVGGDPARQSDLIDAYLSMLNREVAAFSRPMEFDVEIILESLPGRPAAGGAA